MNSENSDFVSAISAEIDLSGNTFILIYWKPTKVTGYNLYRYLFSWKEIPGNDSGRLTDFLKSNYNVEWVKTAKIAKTDDEKTIMITAGKNILSLNLYNENTELNLIINNDITDRFIVETENGNLNIYHRLGVRSPLNGFETISCVKTCEKLKSMIPEGTIEWKMLVKAFEDQDPCSALEQGLTAKQEEIFDLLATINLKLRLARGLGYIDHNVNANQEYVYELKGIGPDGKEFIMAQNIKIVAGHYGLPKPPSEFILAAGDRKVLATWKRDPGAFNYVVQRSINPAEKPHIINEEPIFFDIDFDLQGKKIGKPGFLDLQRWSKDGLPESHVVNGNTIDGPENYVTYYYQVASRDILNRTGTWSDYQSAIPIAMTPPVAPINLRVDPITSDPLKKLPGLALSWRKVTRDINNHQILDQNQTYDIYRADTLDKLDDLSSLSNYFVGSINANPTDPAVNNLTWNDMDDPTKPILVPPYGEKDFWYRIRCVDDHGNISSPSAAISGRIPDTRAPGGTRVVGAEGHSNHITIYWTQNNEEDLAGYYVYRSICDKGKPATIYKSKTCDFEFIDTISLTEAKARLVNTGRIYYDDYSVPEGSPLCYVYWIRAFDTAQNIYQGERDCPASKEEYVCQRLYEETPPAVPIISRLKARNNSVLIEWIASPVQDLRAFHVYRSEKEEETPDFVACILIDGTVLIDRWRGMKPKCEEIPAKIDPEAAQGSFRDEKVEPNRVYWYRVSALDWLGNESEGNDIRKIPAISTFTYSTDLPIIPVVIPQMEPYLFNWDNIPGNDDGKLLEYLEKTYGFDWVRTAKIEKFIDCQTIGTIKISTETLSLWLRLNDEKTKVYLKSYDGTTDEFIADDKLNIYKEPSPKVFGIEVSWNPPFDDVRVEGYIVFRSSSEVGSYRQVSPIVKGNSFSDASALRGTNYWYCVQALDKSGRHSKPSIPVQHKY